MSEINKINYASELNNITNGSCSLDIGNLLDEVQYEDRDKILELAISKIKYDGKILLSGIDIFSFCRIFLYASMTIQEANTILSARSFGSIVYIIPILQRFKIQIIYKNIDNIGRFTIEGIRKI